MFQNHYNKFGLQIIFESLQFPQAAFCLETVTTNSLRLHIFFTFRGVQYTVKIGL